MRSRCSIARSFPLLNRALKAKSKIFLALASTLFSLIIIEAAIRLFDPLGISYFEEATRYHLDKVPDPVLVFKHAPNLRKVYQGVEVKTNAIGLRDRELVGKQKDEIRILLLGDSVTFGWGVLIDKTFGRKLENLLSRKLQRSVKVCNAGVGSYNTVQEYASLQKYGNVLNPDAVLLLYVDNDIEINKPPFEPWDQRSFRGKSPAEVLSMLVQKSRLYRLAVFTLKYAHPAAPAPLNPDAPGVKESLHALGSISDYCRRNGIPFAAIFYRPARASKPVVDFHNSLLREIQKVGRQHHFPVAETGPWWGNAKMESITNSAVDSHPNAHGHDLLAKGMAHFLVAHDLLEQAQ